MALPILVRMARRLRNCLGKSNVQKFTKLKWPLACARGLSNIVERAKSATRPDASLTEGDLMQGTSQQLDPAPILHTAFGFWNSKVLLTAVGFDLFKTLGKRKLTG